MNQLDSTKHGNANAAQLISASYWSFSLGFGALFPFLLAWIFRRDRFLLKQLLQSAFVQLLFFSINAIIFGIFIGSYFEPQGSAQKLSLIILQGTITWFGRIILFIVSVMAWRQGEVTLPFFSGLADWFMKFTEKKSLKKAFVFNLLWPGSGQLYLGKGWLGWILAACFFVTILSWLHLWMAYNHLSYTKDLLSLLGFYWRVGDQRFSEDFATPQNLLIVGGLLIVVYLLSILSLPLGLKKKRSLNERRIIGSFGISYLVHLAMFWIVMLMPFVFTKSATKEALKERSKQIEKQLRAQKDELQKAKNKKPSSPPPAEREIRFDLEMPDKLNGLNDFSNKPFSRQTPELQKTKPQPPAIGYGERKMPLPPRQEYVKQHARKTKSYSEYLTSKVRENDKDKLIWEDAPYPYSIVVEYTVSPDGYISDIRLVQPSRYTKNDSMVVSVLESMNPVIKPPSGQSLKITELFWNTGGQEDLDTDLKRSLANYPDGRVIEVR